MASGCGLSAESQRDHRQPLGAGLGFVTTFCSHCLLSPAEIGLTRVLVEAAILVSGHALLLATNSLAIRYYPYCN